MNDDKPEPSVEVRIESIRRTAADLPAYDLDVHLAVAVARRDVAAAHGMTTSAEAWQELTLALHDVRRMRAETAREIDALTGPPDPVVRPLTPDELGEG